MIHNTMLNVYTELYRVVFTVHFKLKEWDFYETVVNGMFKFQIWMS